MFDPTTTTSGAHTLTYTFTDGNGCINSATDDITVDPLPIVLLNLDGDKMCSDADPLLLSGASPTGGVYTLNGQTLVSDKIDPSNTGDGVLKITYTYTDSQGCVSSMNDNFTVNPAPNADLGPNEEVCKFLDVVMTVPESGMRYLWNTGWTKQSYPTNKSGYYVVSVTNPLTNCSSTDFNTLSQGSGLFVDLGDSKQNICEGTPLVLNISSYDKIVWSGNTALNGTSYTSNKTETIDVFVLDAKGCFGVDIVWTNFVNKIDFELRTDTTICEGANDIVLLDIANEGVTVEWNDGSTDLEYQTIYAGEYTATITDAFGCTAQDTVSLRDSCSVITITMPNIFTPNYNSVNNYMRPLEMEEEPDPQMIMRNLGHIRFSACNRWGVLVYVIEGRLPKWDGRGPNGLPCADGTYFWKLDYIGLTDEVHNENGFVKLLRTIQY